MEKKKITNFEVEVIPGIDEYRKNLKTNILFDIPYPNIYLLAQKDTGKTTVIYNILKELTKDKEDRKNIIILFFCSQIYRDKSYEEIVKEMKKRGVSCIIETSFYTYSNGKKVDQLERLKNFIQKINSDVWLELDPFLSISMDDEEVKLDEDTKLIIVIDDLSSEIKTSKVLEDLLKANRHMNTTIMVSTQSKNDLPPNCINQMQYILAFDKIPKNKLEELHSQSGLKLDLDTFYKLYHDATFAAAGNSKNFLYINTKNNLFRKNFNHNYIL